MSSVRIHGVFIAARKRNNNSRFWGAHCSCRRVALHELQVGVEHLLNQLFERHLWRPVELFLCLRMRVYAWG